MKKYRKRKAALLLAGCLCAALCSSAVSAANQVPEMEIRVALQPDGSANITQIWYTETEEGTEFYLSCRDSGYLTITDLSVADENGSYTFTENWRVDASFEEKADRCGIHKTDEGVELCWGISEYGKNRYVIEYVLHDLVSSCVLQPSELEQYCQLHYKPLADFLDSCGRDAEQTLVRTGCIRGAVCDSVRDLTRQGKLQLDEILGLKRFLLDFSLIYERGVKEVVIWQDYMIYALLLGIADKVAPQIRKLYPDALPQIRQFERYMGYAGYYNGLMYGAYDRERQRLESIRSGGGGGKASFGGGGGFSGGGGGGIR